MIEHNILKVFVEDTTIYDKYGGSLKLDFIRENYPVLYKFYKCLPATSFDALEANYLANYPVLKDGDRQVINNLVTKIKDVEVDMASITTYLESHLQRVWANEIALTALEVTEGRKTIEQLDSVINQREVLQEVVEDEFVSTDIEFLISQEEVNGGLNWRLKCLNQSLGPLRKGNFGHIFARTETGKTAMWVSEVTYMLKQVTSPILIMFNEEDGAEVVWRMYSAVTGLPYKELLMNPKRARKIWLENNGDCIKFIDDPLKSEKKQIERLVETIQPSLIIIDNLDKVKGFTGDREDMRLHEIYKWARELAKKYCPLISVGQASTSGHNTMLLDETDLASSKTGKPSELDFILGIGRIDKVGYENVRYLSLPKNKLRGDKDTVTSMRHIRGQPVLLNPDLSYYEDM